MPLSLAAEIATYLQSQGLGLNFSGTGTINLFVSVLPDTPDSCVAIFERGGYPPVLYQTGSGGAESKLDNPVVQIRTRAGMTRYTDCLVTANAIYGKLQGKTGTTLNTGGAFFNLIDAQQSPTFIGRDTKERPEFSQNFHVQWISTLR